MRAAELGRRYDPARYGGPEARPAMAVARPVSYVPYPNPHPRRGAEPHARAGQRPGTGFEPFLIAAVFGLLLWALILAPFLI